MTPWMFTNVPFMFNEKQLVEISEKRGTLQKQKKI